MSSFSPFSPHKGTLRYLFVVLLKCECSSLNKNLFSDTVLVTVRFFIFLIWWSPSRVLFDVVFVADADGAVVGRTEWNRNIFSPFRLCQHRWSGLSHELCCSFFTRGSLQFSRSHLLWNRSQEVRWSSAVATSNCHLGKDRMFAFIVQTFKSERFTKQTNAEASIYSE